MLDSKECYLPMLRMLHYNGVSQTLEFWNKGVASRIHFISRTHSASSSASKIKYDGCIA